MLIVLINVSLYHICCIGSCELALVSFVGSMLMCSFPLLICPLQSITQLFSRSCLFRFVLLYLSDDQNPNAELRTGPMQLLYTKGPCTANYDR